MAQEKTPSFVSTPFPGVSPTEPGSGIRLLIRGGPTMPRYTIPRVAHCCEGA